MLFRFTRLFVAVGLLVAIWALSAMRKSDPRSWVRPVNSPPGPVRITQFYASVGTLLVGQKALLCYGVENAKSVRISPGLSAGVYPSPNHCLEIVPEHTTHYIIQAVGFDGNVAMKSFTLAVQARPVTPQILNYATMGSR
jgi:hypothetical protein